MIMLRTALRFALALTVAAPALQAQAPAGREQAAKPKLDAELAEHFKGIELTDEQIRKVTEIKAKHHKAMDQLRHAAPNAEDPKLKADLKKLMDAEHAEFMTLLTAEQKKRFEENMKAHHPAEAGAAHGAGHGEHKKPETKKP